MDFHRKENATKYSGVLKCKKKHRISFLAPKWYERYFELDDAQQAMVQYKHLPDHGQVTENPEMIIPFNEISSVLRIEHYFSKSKNVFELVMKETASVLPPGSVWSFEASSEEICTSWVDNIVSRTNVDSILLAKEDIKTDYRHFYQVIHDRHEILGTGMTGMVKKVQRVKDGKLAAMKTIRLSHISPSQRRSLQNEIDILKTLDHPHIAKLYQTFVEPGHCVRMILELCEGGELFDRLHKKRRFNEHYTAELMTKMLSVLNYLHGNGIVHRDLKLENWLFRHQDVDDTEIVLIDFGLSKLYKTGEHMHRTVGTSYYVAPEVLAGDYVGYACDIWSLGVICFMLLGGTAPFDGADDDEIIANVKRHAKPNMQTKSWMKISPAGKDFVLRLLTVDPQTRPTAKEALAHPWITMEEQSRPAHEIDSSVLACLQRFTNSTDMKRIALEVVAFNLDHDEIKQLTDTFEALDQDSDGYISFTELRDALKSRFKVSEEEVGKIFEALDQEHTGKVHVNEFVAAALQEKYYHSEERLADAFHALDQDNSGYITFENVRKVLGNCASKEQIRRIFSEVHEVTGGGDPDTPISYSEFIEYMRKDNARQVQEFRDLQTNGTA